MIRKSGDKFEVTSEDGKRSFGSYATRAQAEHRLRQVEYFKHHVKKHLSKGK